MINLNCPKYGMEAITIPTSGQRDLAGGHAPLQTGPYRCSLTAHLSWSLLQPEEERYEFGWLDEILDLMAKNSIYACLATSTAAHPAWMARRYPDVLRVDFQDASGIWDPPQFVPQ